MNDIDTKPLEQIIKDSEGIVIVYLHIGYNKDKVHLVFKAVPPAQQIANMKLTREYTIGALITFLKKKYPTIFDDNSSLVSYTLII